MPDLIPLIPIQLDKERHLKFTLEGAKRFHSITGKSILKNQVDFSNMNETETIAFIWSCLIWEDRKLTPEDVGFMLDFNRMDEIIASVLKAVTVSLPDQKDDEPKNPPITQTS